MKPTFRSRFTPVVRTVRPVPFTLALVALGGGCAPVDDPLGQTTEEIHANAGSTVTPDREVNDLSGRYPEVMHAVPGGGCTGTVIAPYAVLTAAHCGTSNWTVNWENSCNFRPIQAVHQNP